MKRTGFEVKKGNFVLYKKDTEVSAPHEIRVSDQLYRLAGIIKHSGATATSGHYVAWVRRGDTWFHVDDSRVLDADSDKVAEVSATMALYQLAQTS